MSINSPLPLSTSNDYIDDISDSDLDDSEEEQQPSPSPAEMRKRSRVLISEDDTRKHIPFKTTVCSSIYLNNYYYQFCRLVKVHLLVLDCLVIVYPNYI